MIKICQNILLLVKSGQYQTLCIKTCMYMHFYMDRD